MHPSNKVTKENVGQVVRYHAPTTAQGARHEHMSQALEAFLTAILESAPDCADRSSAIRAAREAKHWASAAIALETEEPAADHGGSGMGGAP